MILIAIFTFPDVGKGKNRTYIDKSIDFYTEIGYL